MQPHHSFAERFVHGNILNQIWSGSVQALGLVNSFLVLTALSVYQFGLYQLILSAIAITNAFSTEFFDNVVVNDISRSLSSGHKSDAKRLFFELAAVKIGLGVVIALIVFLGGDIIARYYGKDIGSFIRLASVLILLRALRSTANKFLGAVVSLRALGAAALEEFAKLLLVSGFFFLSVLSIREVLMASIFGALASAAFVAVPFLREYRSAVGGIGAARRFILPAILKLHGFWIFIRYAATNAARNMIPWLVRFFLNTEAVALYALAANLRAMILQVLPLNLGGLIAWEAAYPKRLAYIFAKSMKYSFWIGLIAALICILIVPLAIKIVFPKYIPAIPLFEALALVIPLIVMSWIHQTTLVALREQKLLTARTFTGIAMAGVTIVILLPIIGLFALVAENFISYTFRLIFYQRNLSRKYPYLKLNAQKFFTFGQDDRVIFRRGVEEVKSFFDLRRWTKSGPSSKLE